jgi:hypothetical protein
VTPDIVNTPFPTPVGDSIERRPQKNISPAQGLLGGDRAKSSSHSRQQGKYQVVIHHRAGANPFGETDFHRLRLDLGLLA